MSETGSIPEKRPDRIVIPLTPGGRKNYYIKLGKYTSFSPRIRSAVLITSSRRPSRSRCTSRDSLNR
jgi:hypothetical protein